MRLLRYALVASTDAAATETPGFRRTIMFAQSQLYFTKKSRLLLPPRLLPNVVMGTNTAGAGPSATPLNPGGATPMIVHGMLPTSSAGPRTFRPPKCDCQNA